MEWRTIDSAPKDGDVCDIKLTRGLTCIIDKKDFAEISKRKWQAHERRDKKGFYAVSSGIRMHRLLLGVIGKDIVDHIDGNGLNNCRENLRIGSQSQNCVNRKSTPGVYLRGVRPKKGKWQAYIKYKGKQRSLGYFDSAEHAHQAYLSESLKLHGDWMPLPDPPKQ